MRTLAGFFQETTKQQLVAAAVGDRRRGWRTGAVSVCGHCRQCGLDCQPHCHRHTCSLVQHQSVPNQIMNTVKIYHTVLEHMRIWLKPYKY